MKKETLLIIQLGYDRNSPRDIRTSNLLPYLKDKFSTTIIAMEYPFKRENIEGVTVYRLPFSFLSRYIFNKTESGYRPKGLVRLLSRSLSFIGNKFWGFPDPWVWEKKRLKKFILENLEPHSIIVCSMIPFSCGDMIRNVCKQSSWKNSKVIFDIGDPLAHNSLTNSVSSRAVRYEKDLLNFADAILVTNTQTALHYHKEFHLPTKKIAVVPQGVDISLFTPKSDIHKSDDKIKLIYAGALYKDLRDPTIFLNTIANSDFKNIEIILYSEISRFGDFSDIKNISVRSRITHVELIKKYQNSDILIMFDNAYGMQTSGKIYELLALEKPILFIYSNAESALYLEVKEYGNVITCLNNKKTITSFFNNLNNGNLDLGNLGYDRDDFSWQKRSETYIQTLED
jgi:glycosyltransferase involved in cell wall biosynthesis